MGASFGCMGSWSVSYILVFWEMTVIWRSESFGIKVHTVRFPGFVCNLLISSYYLCLRTRWILKVRSRISDF